MKPHALNTAFDWRERRGPLRRLSVEQAEQYDSQGYLVLEDVFEPSVVEGLIAALDPVEALGAQFLRDKLGGKAFIARADEITFTTHMVTRSPEAKTFTQSAFFQDICHDLIGDDARLYWDQAVYKKPGTRDPFPWHQDNGYTYVEPQQYLTCWVALTDATLENGCPWVVPGVHRGGTLAHEMTELGWRCFEREPNNAIPAPVRAGGVVIFSSLTPHMTGPNSTSDAIRKSYIVQFAPDGASMIQVEGEKRSEIPCDAPDRQYPILVGGRPPS
jgi:phytanoyl-CoA hydroxylase